MKVNKQKFGVLCDGTKVHLYTVSNDNMSFSCMNMGCTITSIVLNNKDGSKTDVLLGFSTLDGYVTDNHCFGAIVGRFANRIGKASFTVEGKKYNLDKNDGPNTLHGGFNGYDKTIWDAKIIEEKKYCGVKFTRTSPDGEQGFPGNVKMSVTYLLDEHNNLTCSYTAQTDRATPINLTNHAYFNLAGNGSIENHTCQMNATKVLEVSPKLIPTGTLLDVKDTPFDFTTEKTFGQDMKQVGAGYDHCYVTEKYDENPESAVPLEGDELVEFAHIKDPASKHEMTVFTNLPGCQLYTGNFIKNIKGKNGRIYENHEAYCFETQAFPDTPNKPDFPSCILQPGEKMNAITIYQFTN